MEFGEVQMVKEVDDAQARDEEQKINKSIQVYKDTMALFKLKMSKTDTLIRQYNDKMKECDLLNEELIVAKNDKLDILNKYNLTMEKVVKLELLNVDYKNSIEQYKEMANQRKIKLDENEKHISQLHFKIKDIEDQNSTLQDDIKTLQCDVKSAKAAKSVEKKVNVPLKQQGSQTTSIEKQNSSMNTDPINITHKKPCMKDKNIMTNECRGIKTDPFPIFCSKCEVLIKPAPIEQILKIMSSKPPLLSEHLSPPNSPRLIESNVKNHGQNEVNSDDFKQNNKNTIALNKEECEYLENTQEIKYSSFMEIDRLSRKVKKLEKQMKDKNTKNKQNNCCHQSCCSSKNIKFVVQLPPEEKLFEYRKREKRKLKRLKRLNSKKISVKRKQISKNDKWQVENYIKPQKRKKFSQKDKKRSNKKIKLTSQNKIDLFEYPEIIVSNVKASTDKDAHSYISELSLSPSRLSDSQLFTVSDEIMETSLDINTTCLTEDVNADKAVVSPGIESCSPTTSQTLVSKSNYKIVEKENVQDINNVVSRSCGENIFISTNNLSIRLENVKQIDNVKFEENSLDFNSSNKSVLTEQTNISNNQTENIENNISFNGTFCLSHQNKSDTIVEEIRKEKTNIVFNKNNSENSSKETLALPVYIENTADNYNVKENFSSSQVSSEEIKKNNETLSLQDNEHCEGTEQTENITNTSPDKLSNFHLSPALEIKDITVDKDVQNDILKQKYELIDFSNKEKLLESEQLTTVLQNTEKCKQIVSPTIENIEKNNLSFNVFRETNKMDNNLLLEQNEKNEKCKVLEESKIITTINHEHIEEKTAELETENEENDSKMEDIVESKQCLSVLPITPLNTSKCEVINNLNVQNNKEPILPSKVLHERCDIGENLSAEKDAENRVSKESEMTNEINTLSNESQGNTEENKKEDKQYFTTKEDSVKNKHLLPILPIQTECSSKYKITDNLNAEKSRKIISPYEVLNAGCNVDEDLSAENGINKESEITNGNNGLSNKLQKNTEEHKNENKQNFTAKEDSVKNRHVLPILPIQAEYTRKHKIIGNLNMEKNQKIISPYEVLNTGCYIDKDLSTENGISTESEITNGNNGLSNESRENTKEHKNEDKKNFTAKEDSVTNKYVLPILPIQTEYSSYHKIMDNLNADKNQKIISSYEVLNTGCNIEKDLSTENGINTESEITNENNGLLNKLEENVIEHRNDSEQDFTDIKDTTKNKDILPLLVTSLTKEDLIDNLNREKNQEISLPFESLNEICNTNKDLSVENNSKDKVNEEIEIMNKINKRVEHVFDINNDINKINCSSNRVYHDNSDIKEDILQEESQILSEESFSSTCSSEMQNDTEICNNSNNIISTNVSSKVFSGKKRKRSEGNTNAVKRTKLLTKIRNIKKTSKQTIILNNLEPFTSRINEKSLNHLNSSIELPSNSSTSFELLSNLSTSVESTSNLNVSTELTNNSTTLVGLSNNLNTSIDNIPIACSSSKKQRIAHTPKSINPSKSNEKITKITKKTEAISKQQMDHANTFSSLFEVFEKSSKERIEIAQNLKAFESSSLLLKNTVPTNLTSNVKREDDTNENTERNTELNTSSLQMSPQEIVPLINVIDENNGLDVQEKSDDAPKIKTRKKRGRQKKPVNSCQDKSPVRELRSRQVVIHNSVAKKIRSNSPVIPLIDETNSCLKNSTLVSALNEFISNQNMYKKRFAHRLHYEKNERICVEQLDLLINTEQWTNEINSEIMKKLLSAQDLRNIAMFIIEYLILKMPKEEVFDKSHTPPAPIMTRSEQKLITLIWSINNRHTDFIDIVTEGIQYKLFRLGNAKTVQIVERLFRILVVLNKIKKDREKVRIFCCDALYCLNLRAINIIYVALTCWPEVLPKHDSNNDIIVKTIVHVVMTLKVDKPYPKLNSLRQLLSTYYQYPSSGYIVNDFKLELLNKLQDNVPGINTAVLLLCKRMGTSWTLDNIITALKQMIVTQSHPSLYEGLTLLGNILRSFPKIDSNNSVGEIIDQLCDVLARNEGADDLQEGVVSCLLSINKFRYEQIARSVIQWQSNKDLRPATRIKLISFFKEHDAKWWAKFIKSNYPLPK